MEFTCLKNGYYPTLCLFFGVLSHDASSLKKIFCHFRFFVLFMFCDIILEDFFCICFCHVKQFVIVRFGVIRFSFIRFFIVRFLLNICHYTFYLYTFCHYTFCQLIISKVTRASWWGREIYQRQFLRALIQITLCYSRMILKGEICLNTWDGLGSDLRWQSNYINSPFNWMHRF
jgi:hypothetical protein